MKYKSYNSSKINTDVNDIFNFVYNFYKEIIFILIISFISGISFYSYKLRHSIIEVKSEIEIRHPSADIFQAYNSIVELKLEKKIELNNVKLLDEYNKIFYQNLLSKDNLFSFLEQSDDLDSFKKSLGKSSNIYSQYFNNNKFGATQVKDKIILNKIFLVYPHNFNGRDFLEKYVLFNETVREFKNKLTSAIKNNILIYEEALEIANKINLLDPILKSYSQYNIVVNEPETLFYKGANVLRIEIINKEKLLKKLENDKFEYNPILEKSSVPIYLNSSYNKFNFFIGLLFGFLLSFLIIFFKTLLKKVINF